MIKLELDAPLENYSIVAFEKLSKEMAFEMHVNKEMEISNAKGGSVWLKYMQNEQAVVSGCPIVSIGQEK